MKFEYVKKRYPKHGDFRAKPISPVSETQILRVLKKKTETCILTDDDGSYLQVAGSGMCCGLEWHDMKSRRHYRAFQNPPVVPWPGVSSIGAWDRGLKLHQEEYFRINQVTEALLAFLHHRPLPEYMKWRDLTPELETDEYTFRAGSMRFMFPEMVRYTSARVNATGVNATVHDWAGVKWVLDHLNEQKCPYLVFALPDESYVQCFGGQERLMIEARIYRPDGSFTHWAFGRRKPLSEPIELVGSTGKVTIDVTQQLTMRDARAIISQFLETRTFPDEFYRQDITQRFTTSQGT